MPEVIQPHICVIVGASHGGVNLAFNLRKEGWEGEIILYDSDPELPYHRPPLSKDYLTAETSEKKVLKPLDSYKTENIQLRLGVTVEDIDTSERSIKLSNGTLQNYDKLVLATGARAFLPKIEGLDQSNYIFTLRTAADSQKIKDAVSKSNDKRIVVIGGGYIGLEVAASLKMQGADVTVLEREASILYRVGSHILSNFFTELHYKNDVHIHTKKNVIKISEVNNYRLVECDDHTTYKADVVIVGVGVKVNTKLAECANLNINNGIVVNEFTQTSDKDIYAIGDCTNHYNKYYDRYMRLESVQNAVDQSKTAAMAICGTMNPYISIPWFWSDQYDIKLQMVGLSEGYEEALLRKEEDDDSFSIWYFKDNILIAVNAVNNARAYMLGTKFIKSQQKIDKSKLMDSKIVLKPNTLI